MQTSKDNLFKAGFQKYAANFGGAKALSRTRARVCAHMYVLTHSQTVFLYWHNLVVKTHLLVVKIQII